MQNALLSTHRTHYRRTHCQMNCFIYISCSKESNLKMFPKVFNIFAHLSACIYVLIAVQSAVGFSPTYAVSDEPAFIPGPFISSQVSNPLIPVTAFSKCSLRSSALRLDAASASYSQSAVSGLPTVVGLNPPNSVSDGSVSIPIHIPSYPLSNSQSSSSASQLAVPNVVPTTYLQSPVSAVTIPEPSAEAFANSFVQALTSSNILKPFIDFELSGSTASTIFRDVITELLLNEGFTETSLSDVYAQAVRSVDLLTPKLYFDAVGNTVGRFLQSKGLLTPETSGTLLPLFLHEVQNAAVISGVTNPDSIFRFISIGFNNFIKSLGFRLNDIATEVARIFVEEIVSCTN